jgi:hypothetical protein
VRGGGAAAVGGADGASPETAGPPHCARPGAVVAAALAAAELVLAALLFLQASRLILLLSLSGRFLPHLGRMLAASTTGAAGVAVLQYKLVSTFPPTVLYTNFAAIPLTTQVLNMFFSTVAGCGVCCELAGLVGGGGSGASAVSDLYFDNPPSCANTVRNFIFN